MLKIDPLRRGMWRRAQVTAEEFHVHGKAVFDALSPGLFRDVFLVGFPDDPEGNVELAGPTAPDASVFAGLNKEMHRRLIEVGKVEDRTFLPLGYSMTRQLLVVPDLIEEVLNPMDPATVSFPSVSIGVNEYRVSVVLRLDRAKLAEQPRIARGEEDDSAAPDSLADALVTEFQRRCRDVLHAVPHLVSLRTQPGELLRAAGDEFMKGVAAGDVLDSSGPYSLFQHCDIVSSMPYEGTESLGSLIVVPDDDTGRLPIKVQVHLAEPVPLEEHRTVRKLVQITDRDLFLVSDGRVVSGFGSLLPNTRVEDLAYSVNFVRHHTWELLHGGKPVMRVKSGVPGLPLRPLQREAFAASLATALPGANPSVSRLWLLVEAATKQSHGTTLVVSAAAADEARRLGAQGVPLLPVQANAGLINRITSIDGAVLLDPDGMCHAIGIILDGHVAAGGTRSRGARYNSAVRYAEEHPGECLVVVVSEDGMVDLVP